MRIETSQRLVNDCQVANRPVMSRRRDPLGVRLTIGLSEVWPED
jgi:hypothetical protein